MENIIEKLIEKTKHIKDYKYQGATNTELRKVESSLGQSLPSTYRDFLKLVGRSFGPVFEDVHFRIFELQDLQEEFQDLLEDESIKDIDTNNNLAITGYQGFSFHFIETNNGNDPPVKRITEGHQPEVRYNHFSEFIIDIIDSHIEKLAKTRKA